MQYIKANKNKDIILQLQAWYRFQVFPHTSRSSKDFRKRLAVSRISLLIALSSALFWEITEARLKMESQISSSCTAKWATCGLCLQDCTQSNRDPKNKDLGESKTQWQIRKQKQAYTTPLESLLTAQLQWHKLFITFIVCAAVVKGIWWWTI